MPAEAGHLIEAPGPVERPLPLAPDEDATPRELMVLDSLNLHRIRWLLTLLVLLVIAYTLFFARDLLMPIVLGFLLALTLTPVTRWLRKRLYVPEWLSGVLLVLGLIAALVAGGYAMSGPITTLVSDAPTIGERLKTKFRDLTQQVTAVQEATKSVEELTTAPVEGDQTVEVVVKQPGLLSNAANTLARVGATLAVTFLLAMFLLGSGTFFYEKLVESMPRLSDKKRALRVVYDIESRISHYLFTITVINCGLGLAIGTGLWLYGMQDAFIWGAMATVLNFLPYIGAVFGIGIVGVFALLQFPTLFIALGAPAIYLVCTAVEGQVVTPIALGRRLEMNTVAVFLAIAFWGWLWGIAGTLMAVPLLVVIKVIADNFPRFDTLARFLSGPLEDKAEEAEAAAPPPK